MISVDQPFLASVLVDRVMLPILAMIILFTGIFYCSPIIDTGCAGA